MRKRCKRRVITPLPPKGLRPKLDAGQQLDLNLCHIIQLDSIANGHADEHQLWDFVGATLTWSKVAELMQLGLDEMNEQLGVVTRLVERYGRTGLVRFTGSDYQLAKQGLAVMDELALRVDKARAIVAADWSENELNEMAKECALRRAAERPVGVTQ